MKGNGCNGTIATEINTVQTCPYSRLYTKKDCPIHAVKTICTNKKCNYEWISRIKSPKSCPKCKQYFESNPLQELK